MLQIENTALAVIDVQGKLADIVHDHAKVMIRIQHLIKAAQAFGLPILWSEQAPDKIGETTEKIKSLLLPVTQPIHKRTFSCYDTPEYVEHLRKTNKRQIIIAGIETHVCVYQTARDLKAHGYEVQVIADAVSARQGFDHQIALSRLRHEGIITTSTEMVLCELLKTADHPRFKEIIVKR